MQLGENSCSTTALTKSFGWGDLDTFVQHDVQELCRVLMDNLERKMTGTPLEGRIANLFRGRFRSFIRCLDVDYKSENIQEFYDLSMVVRGCPTLISSFQRYVETEILDGDNKYSTPDHGKQRAEMGTEFVELPSILQLHLRRFEMDWDWNQYVKINDRFEFPATIDLSPFLAQDADGSRSAVFELFGVLVHTGGARGGHYYAFLRPSSADEWFEFNDTRVSRATAARAIEQNYGGDTSSGYMLVYVRQEDVPMIFAPVDEAMIADHLKEYVKNGDRSESPVSEFTYEVAADDCAVENAVNGKVAWAFPSLHKKITFQRGSITNMDVYNKIAAAFELPVSEVRLWNAFSGFAPYYLIVDNESRVTYEYSTGLVLQRKPAEEPVKPGYGEVFFFVRFYHESLKSRLQYIGGFKGFKKGPVSDLFPAVARKLGFPEETDFLVFEWTSSSSSVKKIPPTHSFATAIAPVSLILQLEPGAPLPPSDYPWASESRAPPTETSQTTEKKPFPELPVIHNVPGEVETVEHFLHTGVEAVVFRWEDQTVPVCRISFVPTIVLDQFKRFLASVIPLDYDPATSSMIIYKKDLAEQKPGASVKGDPPLGLSCEFSVAARTEYYIWVKFLAHVPESELALSQEVTVYLAEVNNLAGRTHQLLIPKGASAEKLREQLISTGLAPDDPNLTLYRAPLGKPDRRLLPEQPVGTGAQILVAVIPAMGDGQRLLRGAHVINQGTYFHGIPPPFLLVISAEETVAQIVERVKAGLALPEVEWKRLKLVVGDQHALAARTTLLKGEGTFQEFVTAARITGEPYLFISHPSKTGPVAERALRIYN
jgi:ubiquitin carboxyl-terminal hydrolase 7